MSKIQQAFIDRKAFIPFFTCGDPDLDTTKQLVLAAADAGAGIIELGIPFSDPTAEGPVIQEASLRALQAGTTTDKIFDMVNEIRKMSQVPLCFMTYANVVYSYGPEKFLQACSELGIDGLILPDIPFEEKEEFQEVCSKYGVELISFIAPTSASRIEAIASEASGFIYLIAALGVTGMRSQLNEDLAEIVQTIRTCTNVPVAVGFGISNPEQARKMAEIADGVICGSAIVNIVAEHGKDSVEPAANFIADMVQAVSQAS